jgi:putative SOS response-associated peptidase YedK
MVNFILLQSNSPQHNAVAAQTKMAKLSSAGGRAKSGSPHPIPSWAKNETSGDKPSFRRPFERQRCLIPADGF